MKAEDKIYSRFAQTVTNRLLDSVKSGDEIDQDLIAYAEDVIQVHQLIVQLSFVGLIVDRLPQLSYYNEALDNLIEQLDTHDLAEASLGEKIRAAAVCNQAIKTTVDVINDMMASKDAVNMLIASLKETFGKNQAVAEEDTNSNKQLMNRLNNLSPKQRQQLLAGAVTVIRAQLAAEDEPLEEEDFDEQ